MVSVGELNSFQTDVIYVVQILLILILLTAQQSILIHTGGYIKTTCGQHSCSSPFLPCPLLFLPRPPLLLSPSFPLHPLILASSLFFSFPSLPLFLLPPRFSFASSPPSCSPPPLLFSVSRRLLCSLSSSALPLPTLFCPAEPPPHYAPQRGASVVHIY